MQVILKLVNWATTPYTIYLVLRDPEISWSARLRAVSLLLLMFVYIISPVDLLPDLHPFTGWLDDLVIIPLVMALTRKVVPEINLIEKREKARSRVRRVVFSAVIFLLIPCAISLALLVAVIFLIVRSLTG